MGAVPGVGGGEVGTEVPGRFGLVGGEHTGQVPELYGGVAGKSW